MKRFRISGTPERFGADGFTNKIKAVQAANLINLWPMNDPGTNGHNEISAARDGTYQHGPLMQHDLFLDLINRMPLFNYPDNEYMSAPTLGNSSVWNRAEGTLYFWLKMPLANLNDALVYTFFLFFIDADNYLKVGKISANTFYFLFRGGAVTQGANLAIGFDPGWVPIAVTWSLSNNRMRIYYKGVQQGADLTPLPVQVGVFTSGPFFGTDGSFPFTGNFGFASVWTIELTAAEIAGLSVV